MARAGDFVWIPRGTAHKVTVTSTVCRALNAYVPAGFEQVIIGLGNPAERRELPPPDGAPEPGNDRQVLHQLLVLGRAQQVGAVAHGHPLSAAGLALVPTFERNNPR